MLELVAMLTEDYLIRMINLAIAALLRIVGLKKDGDYQEALLLIDMTLEQLLGLRSSMARSLDDNRLYFLLTRNDQLDTRRLAIVADLLHQEGDIYAALGHAEESRQDTDRAQGFFEESRQDYARALRFDVEVFFNAGNGEQAAGEPGSLQAKIEDLVEKLDLAGQGERLGADTLWPLAGYYEESGAYARAERLLLGLAGREEIRAEILPEVVAFYERMAQKPQEALAEGGTSLEQVREGLRRWRV